MTRTEYITQLEALLKAARMAPRDMEDALARCNQFICNGGPEREEETIAGMVPPEQMAEEILADYRQQLEGKRRKSSWAKNLVLALLLFPFIIAAYAVVFALVAGGAVCAIIGLLTVPVGLGATLSGGVATLLVFAGSGIMVMGVGLLCLVGGVALCQGSNWCMRRLFGGRRVPA